MALSNILNEPQREITETVVGMLVVGGVGGGIGYADYAITSYFAKPDVAIDLFIIGMLGVFCGMVLAFFLTIGCAVLVHEVGEEICNKLERRGYRLRPARTGRCR